jgi:hypothetical protein
LLQGDDVQNSEAAARAANQALARAAELVNQFSVDISILLSLNPIIFEDFVEGKGSENIFEKVSEVVKSEEEANRVNQQFSGLADHMSDLF